MKNISVLGLGYVGLPTSLILSDSGFKVSGFDINTDLIESINNNTFKSEEPSLAQLLKKVQNLKTFSATNILKKADIYIICVPTPKKDQKSDLSYLYKSIDLISSVIENNSLVVIESTIPIGITKNCAEILFKKRKDLDKKKIFFAHCPERVLPGNAINEIKQNDRVIGGLDKKSIEITKNIYKKFCSGEISTTSCETAEMIKLSENTYRDVNIALANELSLIADNFDININEVIRVANRHPRVNIHKPGIGVGGHCIPIDPYFLIEQRNYKTSIIKTSRELNIEKEFFTFQKIKRIISLRKNIDNIYFYGLTYKPNVGDFRESPALRILSNIKELVDQKYFCAVDPFLSKEYKKENIFYKKEVNFKKNSIIFILTPHSQFNNILKKDEIENNKIEIIDMS